MIDPAEIPCLPAGNTDIAVNCGPATCAANGVWVEIRKGGARSLGFLAPAAAIELAERLVRSAGEVE